MTKYIDGGVTYTKAVCGTCGGPALIDPKADEADYCYDCIAKERNSKVHFSPRQERIRLMERKLRDETAPDSPQPELSKLLALANERIDAVVKERDEARAEVKRLTEDWVREHDAQDHTIRALQSRLDVARGEATTEAEASVTKLAADYLGRVVGKKLPANKTVDMVLDERDSARRWAKRWKTATRAYKHAYYRALTDDGMECVRNGHTIPLDIVKKQLG